MQKYRTSKSLKIINSAAYRTMGRGILKKYKYLSWILSTLCLIYFVDRNETNCFNTLTPHKAFQTTQNQTITTHFHMPIAKPLTKNFTM